MKKTFCVGPLVGELALASDGHWWLRSDKGYRHAFLLGLGTVTAPDGWRALSLTVGPVQLTCGWMSVFFNR